jgi:hypothetical protein
MNRHSLVLSVSSVVFALMLTVPLSAYASSGPILTTTYTLIGTLHESPCPGLPLPCITATYSNAIGSNATLGVIYAVVHNSIGQTILITFATVSPAAGANATSYLVMSGLASGTYNATVFAVNENYLAISVSSKFQVTV